MFLPSSGSENFQKYQSVLVTLQLITISFSVLSEFLRVWVIAASVPGQT